MSCLHTEQTQYIVFFVLTFKSGNDTIIPVARLSHCINGKSGKVVLKGRENLDV